ncbi:MAG: ABC transporter substrate-binding protein [Chloroflexota bacterium]
MLAAAAPAAAPARAAGEASILVNLDVGQITGAGWPAETPVEIIIIDPENPDPPLYTAQAQSGPDGSTVFYPDSGVWPGLQVTLTGSGISKDLLVQDARFNEGRYSDDRVWGKYMQPGALVQVSYWDDLNQALISLSAAADENGDWEVDFSPPGADLLLDLTPGMPLEVTVFDTDGDAARQTNQVNLPYLVVRPDNNGGLVRNFDMGQIVTISVDDPANGTGVDAGVQVVQTQHQRNPFIRRTFFYVGDQVYLTSGMRVSASDGLVDLAIDLPDAGLATRDYEGDLITGWGPPGKELYLEVGVEVGDEYPWTWRNPVADEQGQWVADFNGDDPASGGADLDLMPVDDGVLLYQGDQAMAQAQWLWPDHQYEAALHSLTVYPNENRVCGSGWDYMTEATLSIYDPQAIATYTESRLIDIDPDYPDLTQVCFDTTNSFPLRPGFQITLESGGVQRQATVEAVAVESADPQSGVVSGWGRPNLEVQVQASCAGGFVDRFVRAGPDGYWTADFAHPGRFFDEQNSLQFAGGCTFYATLQDSDRDQLISEVSFDFPAPVKPWIVVFGERSVVRGRGFVPGIPVTLQVDDPETPQSPDYEAGAAPFLQSGDPISYVTFRLLNEAIAPLQPGMTVRMQQGSLLREYTLQYVEISSVDEAEDTVTGRTDPGEYVQVTVETLDGGYWTRELNGSLEDGLWTADFSVSPYPEEPKIDIRAGATITAWRFDPDGDRMRWNVYLPMAPTLTANLSADQVTSSGWYQDTTVTLTVGEPQAPPEAQAVQEATAGSSGGGADPQVSYAFDFALAPGMQLSLTDGDEVKDASVAALALSQVDFQADKLFGQAEPGALLQVTVIDWDTGQPAVRNATAGPDGAWAVDFSLPGDGPGEALLSNLQDQQSGTACVLQGGGVQTCIDLWLRQPFVMAYLSNNTVRAFNWTVGTELLLTIEDPANPGWIYQQTQTMTNRPGDPGGRMTSFGLAQDLVLKPGMIVRVTGGGIEVATVVQDVAITWIDADTDVVEGRAPAGQVVEVSFFDMQRCPDAYRIVTAGPTGAWQANFMQPPQGPDDSGACDLIPESSGTASVSPDDRSSTWVIWPASLRPSSSQYLVLRPDAGIVHANNWPLYSSVTLEIRDPHTLELLYQDTQSAGVNELNLPGSTRASFYLNSRDLLLAGGLVTVSGSGIHRSSQASAVSIDTVDLISAQAHGRAAAGSQVLVRLVRDDEDLTTRIQTTGPDGAWTVDFSQPGGRPEEWQTFNLFTSDQVSVEQPDQDGDMTRAWWAAGGTSLWLDITQADNTISSGGWVNGATVTLTIDDPATPQPVDFQSTQEVGPPWPKNVYFQLADLYTLKPGDLVTVSDGQRSTARQLDEITITQVDTANSRLHGTAAPGSWITVAIWDTEIVRSAWADQAGNWSIDFAHPLPQDAGQQPYQLQPGDRGDAFIEHLDGTRSGTVWYARWTRSSPNTLVFALSGQPDLSLPSSDLEGVLVLNQLQETPFRLNDDGTLEPAAALDYSLAPDGLTYSINLRPGMRWSDGQPVTAQHFVDGLLRLLDPQAGSDYASLFYPIAGAQAYNEGTAQAADVGLAAPDSLTLQITLAAPTSHFDQLLASPIFLPARLDLITADPDGWTAAGQFLSSGPYVLVERDGAHMRIAPNPYYYAPGQVTFPDIAFSSIPFPRLQLAAYQRGDVDVLLNITNLYRLVNADPSLTGQAHTYTGSGLIYLGLNTQQAPTDNPQVRQALAAAVDRAGLLSLLGGAPGLPAAGVLLPELEEYQGEAVGFAYNPGQARQLLAQAGYPGGTGLAEIVIYGQNNVHLPIYEFIAETWRRELGVSVRVEYYRNSSRGAALCRTDPAACGYNALRGSWWLDYTDAYNELNDLFHPDSNYQYMRWDNPRYREIMGLLPGERNAEMRASLIQEAERILVQDQAAAIPLYYAYSTALVRPGSYPALGLQVNFTHLVRWGNSDMDGDQLADMVDPCPADPTNTCNAQGSAAGVVGAAGGEVQTEDQQAGIVVPPGALPEQPLTLSITDGGEDYQLVTEAGEAWVLNAVTVGPHGTSFSEPAAVTLGWDDADNDGVIDGSGLLESSLVMYKDGAPISPACAQDPGCDQTANTFTVYVSSLSLFELVSPGITALSVPLDPQRVGTLVTASAALAVTGNQYTLHWAWGDGSTTVTPAAAQASAGHTYSRPGLYTVELTLRQGDLVLAAAGFEYLVVYDPNGGFLTGGGWLNSPAGAYILDPAAQGKLALGFNCKYKKDGVSLEGSLSFNLNDGQMILTSSWYTWMVISPSEPTGQIKGFGRLNGQNAPDGQPYQFRVWVVDGRPDQLRLQVYWVGPAGVQVVYDNGSLPLGGGSLVVHAAK